MEIRKSIKFLTYILLGIVLIPIIYIFINGFSENTEIANQILQYSLFEYILNTLSILLPVMILTTVMGVLLAYFETYYEYKFKKIFKFTNLASFAIPSYLLAYIYVDFFNGIIYSYSPKLYIDILNIKGAILILSLSFYQYVYISVRSYMKRIPINLLEASSVLGKSKMETFIKIIVPISRPSIVVGASLVFMETLNSYGVPSYFGIQVFSTGIYNAWIRMYDLTAAIKLSNILLIFVTVLLILDYAYSRRTNYVSSTIQINIKRKRMKPMNELILLIFLFLNFLVGFFIPMVYLIRLTYYAMGSINYIELIDVIENTILILFESTIIIIIISTFLNQVTRFSKKTSDKIFARLITVGYSIPGSVIAVGFLTMYINLEKNIFGNTFLSKYSTIIILAYLTRFISIPYNMIHSGIKKIGNSYHEASRIMGKNSLETFFKVDLNMLKHSILAAFMILSIEIIKELPLTNLLVSKPTLAVYISNYASDEQMVIIGPAALILVGLCLLFISIYHILEEMGENK